MRCALLLPLACLSLAGCGFHPLHGAGEASANAKLPDIFVAVIPGRSGQLLRQALQERLAGSSEAEPQGYTLRVGYALNSEAIAINGDNTSGRNRVVGRANWTLSTVAPAPVVIASGDARSMDGFNNVEAQYFFSTLASDTTSQRVADNLAGSITTQISTWFVEHPDAATTEAGASATPPTPNLTPQRGFLGPQTVPGNSDQLPLQQLGPDGLPSEAIGRTMR